MHISGVREKSQPSIIETLQIDDPRADEVVVRIFSSGICHTDPIVRDPLFPVPLPIVLDYEGAGVVEKVGAAVTKLSR